MHTRTGSMRATDAEESEDEQQRKQLSLVHIGYARDTLLNSRKSNVEF